MCIKATRLFAEIPTAVQGYSQHGGVAAGLTLAMARLCYACLKNIYVVGCTFTASITMEVFKTSKKCLVVRAHCFSPANQLAPSPTCQRYLVTIARKTVLLISQLLRQHRQTVLSMVRTVHPSVENRSCLRFGIYSEALDDQQTNSTKAKNKRTRYGVVAGMILVATLLVSQISALIQKLTFLRLLGIYHKYVLLWFSVTEVSK